MSFSLEEKTRYARQVKLPELGEAGQLKLKQSRVVVVGAGGLGCPVITYLAAAGVGEISIIDDDVVSLSNLQRQVLFSEADVGRRKVDVIAERMKALNPNVKLSLNNTRLIKGNAKELLRGFDVVIDGSDNFKTRYLINDMCVELDLPLVAASLFKFEGQLSVYNYKGSPDLRALYPTPPESSERPNCAEIGVIGVLPGIMGTLQANEAIKILAGLDGVLAGKLFVIDALSLETHTLDFSEQETARVRESIEEACVSSSTSRSISYSEYRNSSNYYLLDVRSEQEHKEHSLGGDCIPIACLKEQIEKIPTDKPVLVYCKSGVRSTQAAEILNQASKDFDVLQLRGGIEAVPSTVWLSKS